MRFRRLFSFKLHIKKSIGVLRLNDFIFSLIKPFKKETIKIKSAEALRLLSSISTEPDGTSIGNNTIKEYKYDLQVIVPAYNVEKYIGECLNSIFNQKTHYSYIVIVVDDGSTDATGRIIDEYKNYNNIKIVHQDNKGFSGARNEGLKKIYAKYLTFVDSDDILPLNAFDNLLRTIIENGADIVEGGAFSLFNNKKCIHHSYHKKCIVKNVHNLTGFAWGKIYKSTLFEKRIFPKDYWFEDTACEFTIFPLAKKIMAIKDMVYIYRQHNKSISHTSDLSPKCLDTFWVTKKSVEDVIKSGMPISSEFLGNLFNQSIVNYKRLKSMGTDVNVSVFNLTAEIVEDILHNCDEKPNRHLELIKIFKERDYGKFSWYAKTHF